MDLPLIKPSDIEVTARDITNYWNTSKASPEDKIKILNMVKDYYKDRNLTTIDSWFAQLCDIMINKNSNSEGTGFEEDS